VNGDPSSSDTAGQRLDDLIESVSDAFYAVDRQWRVVICNRAAEAFFGFGRETVLGRDLWDIFPEGRERPFGQACMAAMERGEVSQIEAPSAFRVGRFVELRIGPLRAGGVAVALRDVTERVRAERKTKAAEEHKSEIRRASIDDDEDENKKTKFVERPPDEAQDKPPDPGPNVPPRPAP